MTNIHNEIITFLLQAEEKLAELGEKYFRGEKLVHKEHILDLMEDVDMFIDSIYIAHIPLKNDYNLLDWDEAFIRKQIAKFKDKLGIRLAPTHNFSMFNTAFISQYVVYQAGSGEDSEGTNGRQVGNISGTPGQMLIFNASSQLEAFTPPDTFGIIFEDL